MIKEVVTVFDSYLVQLFKGKPEILRYLLNHERKNMVIVKVCEQINLAEHSNYSKKFDTAKHSFLIFECVKLFSDIALKYAKEKVISRLERQRRIDEACRIDNIAAEFEADQKEFESKKIVSRPGQVAK